VISEKSWRPDSIARLMLGILMTLSVGVCVAGLLHGGGIKLTEDQDILAQTAVMTVFFHFGSLAWIWFFLRQIPMRWSEAFGLETSRWRKAVLWGLAGGLLFLYVANRLQWAMGFFIERATRHPPVPQQLVMVLQKAALPWGQLVFFWRRHHNHRPGGGRNTVSRHSLSGH
jgi:hypothetical protein